MKQAALLLTALFALPVARAGNSPYNDAFWKTWGDGKAEVAGYDLVFPRYGHPRRGVAVAVFVTEPFSESLQVKADPGRHPASDEFQVMKLNLMRDFSTGLYDYNLMTSAFVGLAPAGGRPAGAPAKIAFSAQEWCGQVFHQLNFRDGVVDESWRSYFDGEGDGEHRHQIPPGGLSEDVLPLWARGLAAPFLQPGERKTLPVLRSLATARLFHKPVEWGAGTLARGSAPRHVTVPAGTFTVDVLTADLPEGRKWTFCVESAGARRLVKWTVSDGEKGELRGADRLAYWQMNGPGFEAQLKKIGLTPRPRRTP